MNEREGQKRLRPEDFSSIYTWQDGPNVFYPDHTHNRVTAHIILDGAMTVTCEGKTQTFRAGDRFDVPAHTSTRPKWGLKDVNTSSLKDEDSR